MKRNWLVLFLVLALPLMGQLDDHSRQALNGALSAASASLANHAPFGAKNVAVLSIRNDKGNYVQQRLKNILTDCGFVCVEGKDEPMLEKIQQEIAWDRKKDDILDPDSLVRFGKLKATQILVYGSIAQLDRTDERVYAEVLLHATDLRTKQHIWGGSFAYRFYPGTDVTGGVELNEELKTLLKTIYDKAEQDLLSKKLDVRNVAVIPLAGDIDRYVTNLTVEMLTHCRLSPRNSRIPTLALVENAIRDHSFDAAAILHGAVRDLSIAVTGEEIDWGKDVKTIHSLCRADIQLTLQDVSGNILWQFNFHGSRSLKRDVKPTEAEKNKHQAEIEAQRKKDQELEKYKQEQWRAARLWELEKELWKLRSDGAQQMQLKIIEQEIQELERQGIVLNAQIIDAQKVYTDALVKKEESLNTLLNEQENAKIIRAKKINQLAKVEEELKVIRENTNIPLAEIRAKLVDIERNVNATKNAIEVDNAETKKSINFIRNQMQHDDQKVSEAKHDFEQKCALDRQDIEHREKNLEIEIRKRTHELDYQIELDKKKIQNLEQDLKERDEKFKQQMKEKRDYWEKVELPREKQKWEEVELPKYKQEIKRLELENEDLKIKLEQKRWLPWVVLAIVVGVIGVIVVLSIIRGILSTRNIR